MQAFGAFLLFINFQVKNCISKKYFVAVSGIPPFHMTWQSNYDMSFWKGANEEGVQTEKTNYLGLTKLFLKLNIIDTFGSK